MDVSVDLQARTRQAIAWVWFVAVAFHWTRLSRLIGRDRVNGWAINGMYRLCWFRTRLAGQRWSKWRRAYLRTPDGYYTRAIP